MTTAPVRRSIPHVARVVAAHSLTPRMRRITVRAESMIGVETRPAQDVEIFLREESGRRVKRRYTIRHSRPDLGELDLDVLVHGHGPGSTWGATTSPGDPVEFQGPRGKLELRSAPWHLLVGDEAAIPAIASICEALAVGERAIALIEVGDASDELALAGEVELQWVHRAAAPPGAAELLAEALARTPLPASDGHGYLMGETRAMITLRAVLEANGIAHDSIFVKGYWNIGRPDRIAGRSPESP